MFSHRYVRLAVMSVVLCMAWLAGANTPGLSEATQPVIWELELAGPVGPALSDYVSRNIDRADPQAITGIVLRMDTPGGLDTSMRQMIESILASRVPVIGYVAPRGARAASAGTYILYATHVAAMSPATTLGAATPVQMSPLNLPGRDRPRSAEEEPSDDARPTHPTLEDKAVSDAVAYIRALARLRGRNSEWAAQAVLEAASLSAEEALEARVIDVLADDTDSLLRDVHGRTATVLGVPHVLNTRDALVIRIEPDWRTELLALVTHPTIAYILLMIGVYGLIFEFWNPGSIGPGIVGGICLLLGLYALQFLPVDYTGLALIVLGLAFMVAEAFLPSFGVVGLGGLVAFVIGSVMLMDTDIPGFGISPWVIAAIATTGAGTFLTVFILMSRARRRPVVSGPEEMLGSTGTVLEWQQEHGRVRAHGEIWQATADSVLAAGTTVRVVGRDGLILIVKPEGETVLEGNSR